MIPADRELIRQLYLDSRGDSTELCRALLQIAGRAGRAEALACLEGCVTERRLAWFDAHAAEFRPSGKPLVDGYALFYERYLGLVVPHDGEIVSATEARLVTRWWNPCPTLEACRQLGLDTREVCQAVYHRPVQALLKRLDPRLRFLRNYAALRPHTHYCEEIIALEENDVG